MVSWGASQWAEQTHGALNETCGCRSRSLVILILILFVCAAIVPRVYSLHAQLMHASAPQVENVLEAEKYAYHDTCHMRDDSHVFRYFIFLVVGLLSTLMK